MFDWLFKKVKKAEFDMHKSAVQTALNNCKQDILNIGKWVKHLNSTDRSIRDDVEDIKEELMTIKNELDEIKNSFNDKNPVEIIPLFKQRQTAKHKQTADYGVQTAVQAAVQAAFFDKLSISEKALIGILLNTDMKLSYKDLGAMTGKDSTTIRGQINAIRQKVPGLVEEQIEKNNKKRLYVPDKIKGILFRRVKVRGKRAKNTEKEEENE